MKIVKYFMILFFLIGNLFAQDYDQTFISLRNTGVEEFGKIHPEYDGRGTIILILDTGVDMGVEGLTETTLGEVKVIDVQDFTGQGDTPFFKAEIEEEGDILFFINEDQNLKVRGVNNLKVKSLDDKYFIGVLKEELWKNSGSRAGDINGNGSKNDLFLFVTFSVTENNETYWVVFLDTNLDGDLSNEKPLRNYKEKFDSFVIPNERGLPKFTLGLNILPEQNIVSFYFDDGAHGTHCAGISSGNKISDTEFYGIAPGANVIGLKLGNNNYSGGATVAESMKKAYLYADKISKERKEPCVINMSFGVGAEIEGQSDIELFLKDLVDKNPYLYIATSNGNEGPGLSTSGMPSTSNDIFSTGAVLSMEVGNDLYGTTLDRDIILHFSSRGGEVAKPDVVAPGACVSTVPNFSNGDKMWGTSMASPYSAGIMSVLLGAFKVEFPEVKIPSKLLYKALRESADPMQGYNYLDQGGGLINLEKAYSLLKKYIENGEVDNFETYTVTSFAPNMPQNSAPNLYIRDGSYLSGSETFTFGVKRNNFNKIDNFHRGYILKSDSDWLKVVQKNIHIRHDQSVNINAKIDESILKQPGLYNAKIAANRADKSNIHEFDLMATIVVPYEFSSKNQYTQDFNNEKLLPGMHKRYFLKIPNGTSNLSITVESSKKEYTSVRYYLHDADGREKLSGSLDAKSENGKVVSYFQDIEPGIYEFVILGQYTSEKESTIDLSFEIDGINITNDYISSEGTVGAVNYFSKVKTYNLTGKVVGYQKSFIAKTNSNKNYELPFKLKEDESKITFEISLEKEMFNKVTDFAMMIYNEDGKIESSGGLSYKDGSVTIKRAEIGKIENYKLVIVPGYANAPSNLNIKITEKVYLTSQPDIKISTDNKNGLSMFPFINYKLNCEYKLPLVQVPEGFNYFGEISFKSNKTNEVEFSKIIKIIN